MHAHQDKLTRRAEELAAQQGYVGPGRFTMRHYRLALQEISSADRVAERGLTALPAATPEEDGHYLVRRFVKAGMTQGEAEKELERTHPATFKAYTFSLQPDASETLAARTREIARQYGVRPTVARDVALAEDAGLKAAVANVPAGSLARTEAERRNFARLVSAKAHAAGPAPVDAWHRILPRLDEAEVTVLVTREKLSRADVTEWALAKKGRKPVGLSPAASLAWDKEIEATVARVMDNARMQRVREEGKTT